jgi:hypothetical protein
MYNFRFEGLNRFNPLDKKSQYIINVLPSLRLFADMGKLNREERHLNRNDYNLFLKYYNVDENISGKYKLTQGY